MTMMNQNVHLLLLKLVAFYDIKTILARVDYDQ